MASALTAITRDSGEAQLHLLIEDARDSMEDMMGPIRERSRTYLRWYSPPFDTTLGRHDAWEDVIDYSEDAGTTRNNFPIARAVVDIWTSLEAAKPPMPRAEPEHITPPLPVLDQGEREVQAEQYALERDFESIRSEIRGRIFRDWLRRDDFGLKHHRACRRKNLYGFAWEKIIPDPRQKRPRSHILRNPTTVYPIWSSRDPDELEAVLSVQQESAVRANAKYGLGLVFEGNKVSYRYGGGYDRYQDVGDDGIWFDASRTMVWVEDYWWTEREYEGEFLKTAKVWNAKRVCGKIVEPPREYPWYQLPFVYWENTDERDSFGWSDIAGVIDINDEFNRRLSEEGDILSMYAHPRFQLLGSVGERQLELPDGDEIISLQETERIEQILARIDVYPVQQHIGALIDLLHRVSGLPPIVWGLIANAQTSGRALTASWKATEARLVPKLMRNRQSLRQRTAIMLDYARIYDWRGSKRVFTGNDDEIFEDIRWAFPPMEPRDFQEVTMDAITRRDAGFTTTVKGIRDTGDENAEETFEEVTAEFGDINVHPDKVQAKIMAQDAQLQMMQRAQEMGQAQQAPQGPTTAATVSQAVGQAAAGQAGPPAAAPPGAEGALPPTAPGAAGNAGQPVPVGGPAGPPQDSTLTAGTLVRGGDVSTQLLQQQRLR